MGSPARIRGAIANARNRVRIGIQCRVVCRFSLRIVASCRAEAFGTSEGSAGQPRASYLIDRVYGDHKHGLAALSVRAHREYSYPCHITAGTCCSPPTRRE